MNLNDYNALQRRFRDIKKANEIDSDELFDITHTLLENNSIWLLLDGDIAEGIIFQSQKNSLDNYGGYPLFKKRFFSFDNFRYAVIAYGASNENEGEDALFDILFIRDDKIYIPEHGIPKIELDFFRFIKYSP